MIKIIKSGAWALGGTQVVELTEGEEWIFGAADECSLVEAGWAEWVKAEPNVEVEAPAKAAFKPKAK